MNHRYFYVVLLYCFKHLKGERSTSAIYHLLNGKKSSQTIQDGKLFNLTQMFGLFPNASRSMIVDACDALLHENAINKSDSQHYILSDIGLDYLEGQLKQKPIPHHLNGWRYGDLSKIFWRRISILVQVLSNMAYKRTSYLPVTKNQEDLYWIKRFLNRNKHRKMELINIIYNELHQALQSIPNEEAEIFIKRLTSSHKIGETFEQIALGKKEDSVYIYLLFWNVIHSIIIQIQNYPTQFTCFNEIMRDTRQGRVVTASTEATHSLLQRGMSVTEIASLRRLKESTIEDHIVELTLHDSNFNPDQYLSKNDYILIKKAIDILQTHRLKQVKEYLNDQYSYFQIRLAFAMQGRYE